MKRWTISKFKIELLAMLSLVIVLSGCSLHGHYTGNPKSQAAFAGYEIILNKNETFEIKSWTDNYTFYSDSLGNAIWKDPHYRGFGSFKQKGDFLELSFLNEDSITISIIKSSANLIDSYELSITNEIGQVYSPTVSLKDAAKNTIQTVLRSKQEFTSFQDSLASGVAMIAFDMHLFLCPEIFIPLDGLTEGRNVLKYKTYAGYYPKGTKIDFYCKRVWSGIRYGPKRRWLAKKRKIDWLNSFY